MGILSKTGSILGHFFNFRVDKWIGVSFLKNTAEVFYNSAKALVTIQQERNPEAFDEAVQRLSLSTADLKAQSSRYKSLALLFLFLAVVVMGYGIFLCLNHNTIGFIMTLSLFIYVLTQAFRYHFWHMQIETGKLGCTIKEWAHYLFSLHKTSRET